MIELALDDFFIYRHEAKNEKKKSYAKKIKIRVGKECL